jgi:hypothetical protein
VRKGKEKGKKNTTDKAEGNRNIQTKQMKQPTQAKQTKA